MKPKTKPVPTRPKVCEICGNDRHAFYSKLNGKVLCDKHWSETLLLSIGKFTAVVLLVFAIIFLVK